MCVFLSDNIDYVRPSITQSVRSCALITSVDNSRNVPKIKLKSDKSRP